jgi:hypothetical protein
MDAVVTWRPLSGIKNDDVLSLSVPGGRDAELKVMGICTETKVGLSCVSPQRGGYYTALDPSR